MVVIHGGCFCGEGESTGRAVLLLFFRVSKSLPASLYTRLQQASGGSVGVIFPFDGIHNSGQFIPKNVSGGKEFCF